MKTHISHILKNLPSSPGIYQFFNKNGEIIYIGKSINLKSRVNSYFNGTSKLNFAKKQMVTEIIDIQIIMTNTETESLILEHTLVGEKKPKYNVLLKDDKNYLYIKVTKEDFPKVIKTRIKGKTGTYYGPYTHGPYVFNILKLAKKIFGYGCYGIHFFRQGNEYNLDKYIFKNHTHEGQAVTQQEAKKLYNEKIEEIKTFLKGDIKEVIQDLETKMKSHARELQFEQAAKIKYDIESLKIMEEHQVVRDFVSGDFDVVHILEKYDTYYVGCIEIRNSKIMGFFQYEIDNHLEETPSEILKNFIEQRFAQKLGQKTVLSQPLPEGQKKLQKLPSPSGTSVRLDRREAGGEGYDKLKTTFILPFAIPDISPEIKIEVPKIGGKLDILKLCYKNTYEFAHKKHLASLSTKGFTKKTMIEILDMLGYEKINTNIVFECNDISHLSGTHTVASRSIIENGKKNPAKYRKFNIQTLSEGKIDDFGSMKEIMLRRLKEVIKTGFVPDLIVIDGGKGQLGSVMKVIEEFKTKLHHEHKDLSQSLPIGEKKLQKLPSPIGRGVGGEVVDQLQLIDSLQIVSIAKQEEELFIPIVQPHPSPLFSREEKTTDPTLPSPSGRGVGGEGGNKRFKKITLSKNSDHLRLIQAIRDEAHRFAITFNRDKRISSMKKSVLDALPGIGPVTKKKIIKNFGSIDTLKEYKKEDIENILGKKVTEILEDHGLIL